MHLFFRKKSFYYKAARLYVSGAVSFPSVRLCSDILMHSSPRCSDTPHASLLPLTRCSRPFCSGNQCGTSVSGVMSLHIHAHGLLFVARVGALSYAERQSLPIVTVQGGMIASEKKNLQTTQTQAY